MTETKKSKNYVKWTCALAIFLVPIGLVLVFTKDYHNVDCKNIWTRQYLGLIESVRENLRDPNSFEHIKTVKEEDGAFVISFRSKNGFGGMIENRAYTSMLISSTCEPFMLKFLSQELEHIHEARRLREDLKRHTERLLKQNEEKVEMDKRRLPSLASNTNWLKVNDELRSLRNESIQKHEVGLKKLDEQEQELFRKYRLF